MKKKDNEPIIITMMALVIFVLMATYLLYVWWFDSTYVCVDSYTKCYYEHCNTFDFTCKIGWQCSNVCTKYELRDKSCPVGYECFNTSEEAKKATENKTMPFFPGISDLWNSSNITVLTHCRDADDCFDNSSLEGCWKPDSCNWCCKFGPQVIQYNGTNITIQDSEYSWCTLVYCWDTEIYVVNLTPNVSWVFNETLTWKWRNCSR